MKELIINEEQLSKRIRRVCQVKYKIYFKILQNIFKKNVTKYFT